MAALRVEWTPAAKAEFEEIRERATNAGDFARFKQAHNEVATALSDLALAQEKGEPLYHTQKSGGEIRHWVQRFLSVTYVVFPQEGVGWILRYQVVPESWPW